MIGCEGQRGFAPKAMSEQSHRCMKRQCTALCRQPPQAKNLQESHLLQFHPLWGQESWYKERGKRILKGNKSSLGLANRVPAPASWDQSAVGQ